MKCVKEERVFCISLLISDCVETVRAKERSYSTNNTMHFFFYFTDFCTLWLISLTLLSQSSKSQKCLHVVLIIYHFSGAILRLLSFVSLSIFVVFQIYLVYCNIFYLFLSFSCCIFVDFSVILLF